ncbi:hypothetical protein HYQ45_012580 [Verticillium longisporum]|uniref:Uncharacterized protein n=1 Tax=Verticillium longisporum TaxID=100787 RepID=A0A8I3AK86_VERLO|nr:hypothetical protein HYQ45_012580 [Verticillium longisporum]
MVSPAVPELTEEHIHESIDARTDSLISLRELGPPDLVHLLKQPKGNQGKQHGPSAQIKIVEGLYCCYNAFSRLDMRVHVTIPGSVESYCVDERGEKRKATDELWLETYLCSVLRAYSYADDGSGETIRKIMGVRRFNPVTNTETEHRFLNAAEQLFFRGWQLGSDSVVQVPNSVSNHLTTGLLKYFQTTGRYASGINLFEKLRTQNVEVSSLLAKVLFMGNEEVQGIRVLHQALKESPMDYVMLDTQAEFLLKKAESAATPEQKEERLRMALGCADRSTIAAPSEFGTWARLAQVYVAMEDWENALTILNSCPITDGLRGTPDPTTNGEQTDDEDAGDEKKTAGDAPEPVNGEAVHGGAAAVEKPTHAIDPGEVKADPEATHQNDEHLSKLNNKRLCERWLDSLFMVLYEDLRVYTIWRTQMAQYRAQSMQYRKSAEEWEILGSLAERLQHTDEAMEAYRSCLAARFSPKALAGILRVFERNKNTREAVAAFIRLVTWQYRWYSEFSPELLRTVRSLIEDEGAVKVRSIIQATSMPQNVLDLTHHYAALCAKFRSSGTDG